MRDTIFINPSSHPVLKDLTEAPIVAVKMGEVGYWSVYTPLTADYLNGEEVPAEVIDSAISASMFGWNTPIAHEAITWMATHELKELK